MSISAKLSAVAKRLLAKHGQSMTLSHDAPGAYDPATGTVTNTTTTATDSGVIFPYADGLSLIEGSLIQRGDQQVFISIATAQLPADRITVGTTVYNVINVKEIAPAGTSVLFELQCRK